MAAEGEFPAIRCPRCGRTLPGALDELASLSVCPGCNVGTEVVIFPALVRSQGAGAAAEPTTAAGEAECFYHPTKRAHVPCDACGRFLCALCALDLRGRHLCASCLEGGNRQTSTGELERNRQRWDNIAFAALVFPLVCCYIALPITSALVIAMLLWRWKAPPSLVDNTRARYIVAMILALLEFALGIFFWVVVYSAAPGRP